MAFCSNCGTKLDDGVNFCPACGAKVGAPFTENSEPTQQAASENNESFVDKIKSLNDTEDQTAQFDQQDIADNKGLSVISYIGPLVFIPMFVRKHSKFARFHANQGLILLIADAAYSITNGILQAILALIFPWNFSYGYLGGRGLIFDALSSILNLGWIVFAALMVIGIINVVKGKAKELPVIGRFKILK